MTDTAIVKDQGDDVWTRVRTALGMSRAERVPAYGQAAMARTFGIKPRLGARIEEELARGWTFAAARRVSMSLLLIEIDRYADYFAAYGRDEAEHCLAAVSKAIADGLPRADDAALRLGPASFVIVLSDMPALMARATAARIADAVRLQSMPHKESHAGIVTLGMGLAVTNPEGSYDRRFFEAAAEALKKARRKGMGRIEGVDLRPALERQRKQRAA